MIENNGGMNGQKLRNLYVNALAASECFHDCAFPDIARHSNDLKHSFLILILLHQLFLLAQ